MGRMQPGRDNTSILPLEWAFWQVEFTLMPASNATSRFSDRVENYVRYRPGYPAEALRALQVECGLTPGHVIADVASGTGIWTRRLLENGNRVFAVEPNQEMRRAGERLLSAFPNLISTAGKAEATTLPDASVDFVTAAQAAHWFERGRSASGPPSLYTEEFDVHQRQLRGNLPQAFVHAGMLECAVTLSRDVALGGAL